MVKDTISALKLTSLGAAVFNGTYIPINTLGCEGACNFIRINNLTDKTIFISYNGIDDNDIILPNSALEVRSQQNSQPTNYKCLFKKHMIVYVKSAVAGAGNVYLSGYYQ
jgi:hypothetical protein